MTNVLKSFLRFVFAIRRFSFPPFLFSSFVRYVEDFVIHGKRLDSQRISMRTSKILSVFTKKFFYHFLFFYHLFSPSFFFMRSNLRGYELFYLRFKGCFYFSSFFPFLRPAVELFMKFFQCNSR